MNCQELAQQLNGIEYPARGIDDFNAIAAENGLVIAFGLSDDILKLCGFFKEEVYACDGTKVYIHNNKMVEDGEFSLEALKAYGFNLDKWINSEWLPESIKASWLITTSFEESAPFDIMEDGAVYCRGLVIKVH